MGGGVQVFRRDFEEAVRTNEHWLSALTTATMTSRHEVHSGDLGARPTLPAAAREAPGRGLAWGWPAGLQAGARGGL